MSNSVEIEQLNKDILRIQEQIREAYTVPCLTVIGISLRYLNVLKSRALVRMTILKMISGSGKLEHKWNF